MTNAIDTQLIADAGGQLLWPMIALSNIAQGSAVFAYYIMHRHDELRLKFHFQLLFQLILVLQNQPSLGLTSSIFTHLLRV